MRKFFITIITIMLVGVLCLSSLFGCKLVTTNDDRDMNQVVATVKIDDAPMKTIYKKDVIDHVNVNYGSVTAELFEQGLDDLVQKGVLVQYAMKHFAKNKGITGAAKWDLESYLDDNDILDCRYQAYLRLEELITFYMKDKPEEKLGDTYSQTVRVVPKVSASTETTQTAKKTVTQKEKYIANFMDNVINKDKNSYNAFVKTINVLKDNDLLGNYVLGNDEYEKIETIKYFKEYVTVYEENLIVEKFQEDIEKTARNIVNYEDVQAEYKRLYDIQKKATPSAFENIITNASAQSPVLFGQKGYGMVYHILLKADEEMTAELDKWKEDNKIKSGAYENSAYRTYRSKLFAGQAEGQKTSAIKGQDQRTSWIESKYDFGKETTAINGYKLGFSGDYTLCSDESLPFFGDVTHLNLSEKENEDYQARYRVDGTKKLTLEEVVDIVRLYLYEGQALTQTVEDGIIKYKAGTVDYTNYDEKVKELMFAFSQDDSDTALNTYKGYAIKPKVDGTKQEEWQLEFADAGRQLINEGKDTFMVVETDYGYHIMFVSENFGNDDYDYGTLEEYLSKEFKYSDYKDWDNPVWASAPNSWEKEFNYMKDNYADYKNKNNYLYVLFESLVSTYVEDAFSNEKQEIFAQNINNSQVVVIYEDAYKDIVG